MPMTKVLAALAAFALVLVASEASAQKGGVITIDYLPGKGMIIGVNDQQFEPIPGDEFYHTLLRLWIGEPLQKSIKDGLLGKVE